MNIFLGPGSNLGNRGENLQKAFVELEKWGVKIVRTSSMYESEPVDYLDQPWFYNMAVQAETNFLPEELLKIIHTIEAALGRERKILFGPRTIDIDILFYGNEMIDKPELRIPHPRLHGRNFVLVPLAEIAPDFIHPFFKKTITGLLKQSADKSIVRLV